MNKYIEYERAKEKYRQSIEQYDKLLSEKADLFEKTQPTSPALDHERVTGGERVNKNDNYLIRKEELDEKIAAAHNILEGRKFIMELKKDELKVSKSLHDRIYWYKYIENHKPKAIAMKVGYSEVQIYRILKRIEKNIEKEKI